MSDHPSGTATVGKLTLLEGGAAIRHKHLIERREGTPSPMAPRVWGLAKNPGRLAGAIGALAHVTGDERLRAARGLELERLRKDTFVATLAHELRQPLSTLLAAVEVVHLTSDSAATSRATEIMKRQIDQMNRVVEDLLDAARWASGKVTLRKQRLDVRDVISDATQDVAAAVAARGHALVVATGLEPLWADADPQRLHQVFGNLLRNAVKYTDPGGRISVAADRGAAAITVRISDTGRGIAPDAMRHIFDLYSQVQPFEGAGLGIGLSVVREIVALHEGRIDARSDGPGHGSEFIVTLPLARAPGSLSAQVGKPAVRKHPTTA